MAGKAPKALALPRFWISIRSYKKQLVKKIRGRILDTYILLTSSKQPNLRIPNPQYFVYLLDQQ